MRLPRRLLAPRAARLTLVPDELTCAGAELALSRRLDGRLGQDEQRALGAHLRWCPDCVALARRHEAHRRLLQSLATPEAEPPAPRARARRAR